MNKKIIGIVVFLLILLTVSCNTEAISVKESQLSLEISLNVTGSGRKYHITVFGKNSGDEQLKVVILNMPGGGFKIYNQNEEIVYNAPQNVFPITWDLIIEPGQTIEIYNKTWRGIDNNGTKLPDGDYSVQGVIFTEGEYIFSELVNIHLEKVRSKYIQEFFDYFPVLRILFILRNKPFY